MATSKNLPNDKNVESAEESQFPQNLQNLDDESADLIEVARKLESATSNFQRQQHEYERIRETQQDLKKAMSSIIKGIESLTTQPSASFTASRPIPSHRPELNPCECRTCKDPNCCYYNFIFRKVRMLAGQGIEALFHDAETTPATAILAGEHLGLECQFFVKINGAGNIYPQQLWNYIRLRKKNTAPGVWYDVDQVVNTLSVPQGQTKIFPFSVQVIEREIGVIENTLGLYDENGETSDKLVIDCNCCKVGPIYVTIPFHGGNATGGGAVEAVFEAEKICN